MNLSVQRPNNLKVYLAPSGGGYSGFQVTGMIEWGQKSKPKKSHAEFPTQKKIKSKNIGNRMFVFVYLSGSFYVSVKLPTYPSPKPTLTLISYLGQNVGLGEG